VVCHIQPILLPLVIWQIVVPFTVAVISSPILIDVICNPRSQALGVCAIGRFAVEGLEPEVDGFWGRMPLSYSPVS